MWSTLQIGILKIPPEDDFIVSPFIGELPDFAIIIASTAKHSALLTIAPKFLDKLNKEEGELTKKLDEFKNREKVEKKKQLKFSEKIDELNQETDILLDEIDKWQT